MKVKIYTTRFCGFCRAAKELLTKKGIPFEEIPLDNDPKKRAQLSAQLQGYSTVPMIFIDDTFIGGYSELINYKL